MLEIYWVNTDRKDIQEELRESHREAFDTIYQEYQIPYVPFLLYTFIYENEYRRRRVRICDKETGDEHVIICVARDKLSERLSVYYVSRPYDVNEMNTETETNSYPIAGRFIFSPDDESKSLRVIAMAEDGAIESRFVRLSKLSTLYYVIQRWNTIPGK